MSNPLTQTVVYKVDDSKWKAFYDLPPHDAVKRAYEEHTLKLSAIEYGVRSVEVLQGQYGYTCKGYFCPFERDIVDMILKGKV